MSFKKLVACGLVATLALSAYGPSDTAFAAKKMSLKKTATVTAGKTISLKVKNANKKVKWSTSKKKVATVKGSGKKNAVGKIKGISAGKTVITAKVGKKKLTCKVTVKKAVSMLKAVEVDPLDTSCIVLTMKKATPVNVSDLVIARKNYKEGTYNYKPTIKTIASADQITYRIYLDSTISKGDWLKVTYNKKDTLEKQYLQKVTGDSSKEYIKKGTLTVEKASQYFANTVGTVKYSLENGSRLPDGMTLNTKRGVIKGIPTTPGTYDFKIKATDELGRSAVASLSYNIYDDTVLMVPETTLYVQLNDYLEAAKGNPIINVPGESYCASTEIHPYGGSGKYTFTLNQTDTQNVKLSTDVIENGQPVKKNADTSDLRIPYEITAGEHSCTVLITDVQNPTLSQTVNVKIVAENYLNVFGTAADINGADLAGNELYFYPVGSTSSEGYISKVDFEPRTEEDGKVYGYETHYRDYTAMIGTSSDANAVVGAKKGTYSAELPAGEYIVKINSDADGIKYQMNTTITVSADKDNKPVIAPIRFYSVSSVANYANNNPIANTKVYFETLDRKYETSNYSDMSFSVLTDANGMFVASLPANKYAAYIIDSDGNRQYFTKDIEVTDNLTLTDFKLDIERYTVEGAVSSVYKNSEATPLKNTTLRLYNSKGAYSEIKTTEAGTFKIGLPGNSTYLLKVYSDEIWHTVGTIAVTNQNLTGQNFTYNFQTEVAYATALTHATDTPFTISGGGIAVAKYTAAKDGNYKFSAKGNYVDKMSLYIVDEYGNCEKKSSYSSSSNAEVNINMGKSDTYYIFLVPEIENPDNKETYSIASGNYSIRVDDGYSYSYND